jgi:Ca2+-binding EF-hand superfamily protein
VSDAFIKYDFNKDGTLDLKEVEILMNDCFRKKGERKVTEEDVRIFFERVDVDKDGRITREEMEEMMRDTYRLKGTE